MMQISPATLRPLLVPATGRTRNPVRAAGPIDPATAVRLFEQAEAHPGFRDTGRRRGRTLDLYA